MQDRSNEYEEKKRNVRIYGIILLIVGIGIIIFAVMNLFTVFSSFPNLDNPGDIGGQMGSFFLGGILLIVGFVCVSFGYKLYFVTHLRGIARYAAVETAPAAEIMTEAVAGGLSKGFAKGGGSPFSQGKEVVRVKCRNCGYLETEDADFCSKCGEKV
jgi:flagellar basal body-associated protein FliL